MRLPRRTGPRVVLIGLAAVAMAATTTGRTFATFSGSTSTTGNSLSSATLDPPSGFAVTQVCSADSTIAFRGAASTIGSSGSLTISKPAAVATNDVMLAQVAVRGSGTMVAPPGWNLIRQDPSTQLVQAVYWKVATSAEPGSYTWTSTSTGRTVGGITAYSGVSMGNPVEANSGAAGTGASMAAPSVTTSSPNDMLVGVYGLRQADITAPGSMSQRWNLNSGGGAGSITGAVSDEAFPGPGATGSRTATAGGTSFDWVAQLVALKPSGSPQASSSWTATPSTFATGYKLQRWVGSTEQTEKTLTPRTQTTDTDGPLSAGTTYTYKLFAYYQNWVSSQVSATFTPVAC